MSVEKVCQKKSQLEQIHLRKIYTLKELSRERDILSNKVCFINMVIANELIIHTYKDDKALLNELHIRKFIPMSVHNKDIKKDPRIIQHEQRFGEKAEADEEDKNWGNLGYLANPSDFDYLLNMGCWSMINWIIILYGNSNK